MRSDTSFTRTDERNFANTLEHIKTCVGDEMQNFIDERSFLGYLTQQELYDEQYWLFGVQDNIGHYFTYVDDRYNYPIKIAFCCPRKDSRYEHSWHYPLSPDGLCAYIHIPLTPYEFFPLSFSTDRDLELRRWARTPLDRSEALMYRDKVRSLARPGVYMCILCLSKRMGVPKDVAQMIGRMLWEMRGAFI